VPNTPLTHLIQHIKPSLLLLVVFSLVVNIGMLVQPFFFMNMSFSVIIPREEETLFTLIALLLFVFTMIFMLDLVRHRLLSRISLRVDTLLSPFVHSAMLRYTDKNPNAVLTQPVAQLEQIRMFLSGGSAQTYLDLPFLPLFLIAIYALEPLFLGYTMIAVALVALMTSIDHVYTQKALKDYASESERANRQLQSHVRAGEVVLSMGMKKRLYYRWLSAFLSSLQHQNTQLRIYAKIATLSKTIRHLTPMGMMGLGAYLSMNPSADGQTVSVFVIIAASTLMGRVIGMADTAISSWKLLLMAYSGIKGLDNLFKEHLEKDDEKSMVLAHPIQHLAMSQVGYLSPQSHTFILHDITLNAQSGQLWAIMGNSGSGKSTLAKLLINVWGMTHGSLRINDIELKTLDSNTLGGQVGYLPQDIELLSGSVAQNICRFSTKYSQDQLEEAARLAGIDTWISQLPQGYDTQIGFAEGHLLSGGQRQQIALARAFFGRPSLLVLDEPNANLDEQGEARLNAALLFLKSIGTIAFVVSHRQRIMNVADQLLVLNRGTPSYIGAPSDYQERA
jgi:PrtD family type I secretion system ABC transporter